VPLLVLLAAAINETVDTSSADSGSGNTLALCTGPWTGFLAAAEGFDSTGDESGFGGLLPLFFGSSTAATTRARAIAASAATIIVVTAAVSVAFVATVVSMVAGAVA
jgi:hypothetical protein